MSSKDAPGKQQQISLLKGLLRQDKITYLSGYAISVGAGVWGALGIGIHQYGIGALDIATSAICLYTANRIKSRYEMIKKCLRSVEAEGSKAE